VDEVGNLSAVALLSNNLQACTMIMLYGLIPFVHLTALALGMNAMLLGVLAAYYVTNGISMLVYLAALIPHGIFEFPALILAFAMGLYVCGQLSRRCRQDETAVPLAECMLLILRLLALVLLPLLAAAALMEAYVTPFVASLLF
jgi:stage II sporulation protein M